MGAPVVVSAAFLPEMCSCFACYFHFFEKKCTKYLAMSKKSSTFAPALKKCII
jgi:hypothetical protein